MNTALDFSLIFMYSMSVVDVLRCVAVIVTFIELIGVVDFWLSICTR